MQRYFIEQSKQEVTAAPVFSIKGEDVHHIATVMRMSPGDEVICCAKDGHEAKCRIESVTKEEVLLSVIEWTGKTRELPVQIHIANGLPKGDKLEWIIQKGTELGASSFIPFQASRSVVKLDEKRQRKSGKGGRKSPRKPQNSPTETRFPMWRRFTRFNVCLRALRTSINVSLHTKSHQSKARQAGFNPCSKACRKDHPCSWCLVLKADFQKMKLRRLKKKEPSPAGSVRGS